ncbi:CDP-glycerol glycerophosphotransferase family protein [uncultured Jatrophihabitans sp.]|uniref:CDP-glycerol glycerophosphotransferase family protein n=1 Tax=uncultured Jatrophihabitans sp. TaxID=1610747 RepID=UPI0035CA737D
MRRVGVPALVALLLALYGVEFGGAVVGSPGVVFCALLALWLLELALYPARGDRLLRLLGTASAGLVWRVFLRQLLVVVLLYRAGAMSSTALGVVVAAVLAQHGLLGVFNAVRSFVRSRRWRRLETVNLPVLADGLPPAPPEWLLTAGATLLLATDLTLVAALGWVFAGGSYRPLAPAAVAMAALAALAPLALVRQALALRRLPDDEARLASAQQAVLDLAPLVVLYFSGGATSVYQVNMWFETMERLGRPVLVLLRERRYLADLAPTSLPILCLPFTVDVMNFEMPSARVGLYVANVGRNIHLLREPGLKSAFIGHGDSDKTASFNPATKVYDEVWVAGEAGRQRYVRAQVGVREDEIVLVGRPQLDAIADAEPRPPGAPFTVLYAPTWEGWTDDPYQTSLISLGELIVATLLATPGVRVLYKPHPLTGTVNPAAKQASTRIVAAVHAAGDRHLAVLDNARALYELFNESDALVSDVSSVVSDYLRSGKPYFVSNLAGEPDDVFRDLNPSAGAAYLIGPTGEGLAEGLAKARGRDELSARRAEVRTFLLGDPSLDPMSLFRDAVDSLAARAERQPARAGLHGHGGADIDEPVAGRGAIDDAAPGAEAETLATDPVQI